MTPHGPPGHRASSEGELDMPLTMAERGARVKILAIQGGHGIAHRLAAMGILPGVQVIVKRSGSGGPVVVALGGGRIMLGRGMAHHVLVETLA